MPRALYELVRAPAALTVPGDVLAGATAAGAPLRSEVVGLAAASICLYWAGMALNDYADRTIDAYERSHRPVPSGRVRAGTALAVAVGGTAAGIGLTALSGGRRALAVAVPLAATVWAYDMKLKSSPCGPAAMALARGLDVMLGATAGGRRGMAHALFPAVTMAAHTAAVTRLSRGEVYGASAAVPVATLTVTAAVAATTALPLQAGRRVRPARVAQTALAGWYAYRFGVPQAAAAVQPTADRIRASVGAGIHAMVPLQAALTARAGAPLPALLLAAALPPIRRLSRRVSPT
ncbi:SCO3242 family prenyltransferase [Streptomyces sp. NPDC058751]|uniref:SCO3242 family prenyltransferase n=1 Tax=Streptomyces sp. NPDC058751 TaxID=3346623 RepID=UPI00369A1CE2